MAPRGFARRTNAMTARGAPAMIANGGPRSTEQAVGNPLWERLSLGTSAPLPDATRAFFEPRFGHDFSAVRVHADADSARHAAALSARAFALGHDVYFGAGEFAPDTRDGRALLAHELAHVVQQRAGPPRIARASYQVGQAKINVDYGDVVSHDFANQYQAEIEQRFTAWTGAPATTIHARVAALTDKARRWLLYAIDVVSDNPTAGFDKSVAATRLIDYAPSATTAPLADRLGSGHYYAFENEALRASGWFEAALTAKLAPPTSDQQKKLNKEYNPNADDSDAPGESACPPTRGPDKKLDVTVLTTELDPLVRKFLKGQAELAKTIKAGSDSIVEARSIADVVQAEALSFFAPYIGASHTRAFQRTWQYSAHLTDSVAAGAIPPAARRAFVDNRARQQAAKNGLLDKVHFDERCEADRAVFERLVTALDTDAEIQGFVAAIMSWLSFTAHDETSANVTVNLQRQTNTTLCDARWRIVETLCHELMHAFVSQDFYELANQRQLMTEGFPEVLGDQLYDHIRSKAMGKAKYREQFEGGLPANACTFESIPESSLGYGPPAESAERIRAIVGDARFRAAFFLGRGALAGIQPKLIAGGADSSAEREANAAAEMIGREPLTPNGALV